VKKRERRRGDNNNEGKAGVGKMVLAQRRQQMWGENSAGNKLERLRVGGGENRR